MTLLSKKDFHIKLAFNVDNWWVCMQIEVNKQNSFIKVDIKENREFLYEADSKE